MSRVSLEMESDQHKMRNGRSEEDEMGRRRSSSSSSPGGDRRSYRFIGRLPTGQARSLGLQRGHR